MTLRAGYHSAFAYFHGTSFKVNGTKYYFAPGSLRDSIYQVYSKDNSTASKATFTPSSRKIFA